MTYPNSPLRMHCHGPRRRYASPTADGISAIYGLGMLFQVSLTAIAVQLNRRPTGVPVVDFEDGCDLCVVESLDALADAPPMPFLRNAPGIHPRTGEAVIQVKYPASGGFVPLGALRPDGMPHPAAGTGFALGIVLYYPADHATRRPERPDTPQHFELLQLRYQDGGVVVTDRRVLRGESIFDDWTVQRQALGQAIPAGDDLLFSHVVVRGDEPCRAGVARWRYGLDGWQPGPFVSATPADGPFEPSLLRDTDGAVLLCVRTGLWENGSHFQVFRSDDDGAHWERIMDDPWMRGQSPVSLVMLPGGRPALVANPYRREHFDAHGRIAYNGWLREDLQIFPLTDDRRHVQVPTTVLDARACFGPARQDPAGEINCWSLDHPLGGAFRLGDGRWHTLLGFRVCDRWEIATDASPTPYSGYWLDEVWSDAETLPAWRFA